ncbi:MAG: FtsX-like permease family protein [Actinomycetaceae bacterium]|nr:FtsX-like permease family protein [Actinomycetaceae bacterium]
MRRVLAFVRHDYVYMAKNTKGSLALISVFIVLILLAEGIISGGFARFAHEQRYESALKLVEVDSYGSRDDVRGVTEESVKEFSRLDHVKGVYPELSIDAMPVDADIDASYGMYAVSAIPGLMKKIEGKVEGPGVGEVILPLHDATRTLESFVGKDITFETTTREGNESGEPYNFSLHVVGVYENGELEPGTPINMYANEADIKKIKSMCNMLETTYATVYVDVENSSYVDDVSRAIAGQGYNVRAVGQQLDQLGDFFVTLEKASDVFYVVLIFICLIVGVSIGGAWIRQRYRDIGMLRAIGWKGNMVFAMASIELLLIGFIAGVSGVFAGVLVSLAGTTLLAGQDISYLPIEPWSLPFLSSMLLTLLVVPLCVWLGGAWKSFKATRVTPDEAMRGSYGM